MNAQNLSRRDFVKTGAAAAAAWGLLSLDGPWGSPVEAGSQNVHGFELDDWPILGPYLLPTETPWESLRIAFRGTEEKTKAAGGAVRYGKKTAGEQELRVSPAAKHAVELKGLAPDCEYQYRVDLGAYQSPVCRFRTAPAPGTRAKATKVALIFDFHSRAPGEAAPEMQVSGKHGVGAKGFYMRCSHLLPDLQRFAPDLLVLGGDTVNSGNRPEDAIPAEFIRAQYDTLFRMLRGVCANALVLPVPGNHEWMWDKDLSIYGDYFPLPQNGPGDDKNNSWSTAYGGLGFQMRHAAKGAWIQDTIRSLKAKSGADTILDVQHYQFFQWPAPSQAHGVAGRAVLQRKGVCDVFDAEGGVRLCLYGHGHLHQRTFPLVGGDAAKATSAEKSEYGPDTPGTIYMQCASAWRQYGQTQDNPLVAHNGYAPGPGIIPAQGYGGFGGYAEMTATPQDLVTQTFVYDTLGKVRHQKVDEFRLVRK